MVTLSREEKMIIMHNVVKIICSADNNTGRTSTDNIINMIDKTYGCMVELLESDPKHES